MERAGVKMTGYINVITDQQQLVLGDTIHKHLVWLVGLPLLCVPAFSYLLSPDHGTKTFAEKECGASLS